MSADNTVIILQLKNEYRVAYVQASDNLFWKWEDSNNKELVHIRVFEQFHKCEPLSSKTEALLLADKIYNAMDYVEYGIRTLTMNFSFNEIVHFALEQVEEEISFVYNAEDISADNKVMFAEELISTRNELRGWVAVYE